jgi:hypothetical protein
MMDDRRQPALTIGPVMLVFNKDESLQYEYAPPALALKPQMH